MVACKNSGLNIEDHFPEVRKKVGLGSDATRKLIDYKLSCYACYLIVQNGDPRKKVIALGQTYFAIRTMRQEVARNAGLTTDKEYTVFQNAGYKGLYGGLDVSDIHGRKGLAENDKVLDFMGSEELAANLFRITQTESKMQRENIQGVDASNAAHFKVGREVRASIERVGGTMPENLPTPEKSISEIERDEIRKQRETKKPLMLDE